MSPTVAVVLMAGWFSSGVSEKGVTPCHLQSLLFLWLDGFLQVSVRKWLPYVAYSHCCVDGWMVFSRCQ